MKKIYGLTRLNAPIALRILYIYLLKIARIPIKGKNLIYLNYFYLVARSDFRHLAEDSACFKVKTSEGVCLYLRKHPSSDTDVIYQIWTFKEYEIVIEHIKRMQEGKKRLRIVDAGANVGYTSVYLHHQLKDLFDLEFIVIEPGDDNAAMIEKNFKENKISNYHLEKAGLFNKPCYLELSRDFRDGNDWGLSVKEVNHPTTLKSVELLQLLQKYGWDSIGFCKIDIEGSEKYLFEEAAYANSFLSKIDLIAIEIHEEVIPAIHIENRLSSNSFTCFRHGEITVGYK